MRSYFLLLFAFSPLALAEPPAGKCDFESITQNCKMFDPPGNKIQFPNGTFIPKLNVIGQEAERNAKTPDFAAAEKAHREMIESQLEMMKILDEVPSSRLNSKTKMVMATNPGFFGSLWGDEFDKHAASQPGTPLPWPPNDQNPKVSTVEQLSLKRELLKVFKPEQRKRMLEISQRMMTKAEGTYSSATTPKHSLTSDMTTINEARRKRVGELVEFVRKSMVKNIVGTRPQEQWSP